ncbi:hypothetical protein GGD67_003376 [Bradyrhizobium sp. IAR9]|nr:hypothetical protein [Bradyrhizobium sp. IAR9]
MGHGAVSRGGRKKIGPRLTWASAVGNAGQVCFLWAEISAATGMICRCSRAVEGAVAADFIELFALVRRLLTLPDRTLAAACRVGWSCAMLLALGAVSSALDAIQSLTNSKSSSSTQKAGSSQGATNPFAIDSGSSSTTSGATSSGNAGRYPQISAETMNALFAAQSQSADGSASSNSTSSTSKGREAALKDLFSQIDADGDGKITKSEFEDALGAGGTNLAKADEVFSKMDANADDSINLGEMTKALTSGRHGHHAHGADGAGDASGSGSGSSSPGGGSTTTTTTAADGSTTTTVTYADGFKMSTTVPGASSPRNSAYDLFAQLMQQQGGQGSSAAAGSSMSMSV